MSERLVAAAGARYGLNSNTDSEQIMPIVPVYRLRATPSDPYQRYRFSRDAHPNPNPVPGEQNPDPESRWSIDRVAFYAWSDSTHGEQGGTINRTLVPVYEFYRVGANGLVSYRYSTDLTTPPGWVLREYVAFWMYPARTANAGATVYVYTRHTSDDVNYALSITKNLPEPWINESVLGMAAATIPVVVSVRPDASDQDRFHWSYTPATIKIAYPATLRFVQGPRSKWRFTELEFLNGREDFDTPVVTDDRVLVEARYANPGRDFKYRVAIDVFRGPNRVVSDAEPGGAPAPGSDPSAPMSAASDPGADNETPDRL